MNVAIRGAALVTGVLALVACGASDDVADPAERLPSVELTPIDGGEPVDLAGIEGPAVVNLWATWCAPCRREIPDFEAVHQELGDEVRFVGVNVGEDADTAAAFFDEVGATYDLYLDPGGHVSTALGTTVMPTTIVIDEDGRVTTRHEGPMDQAALEAAIARG